MSSPFGIGESVAGAIALEDVTSVGEPVEGCAGEPFGAEHFGPVLERQVGGDDQAGAFVGSTDDIEEQFGPQLAGGHVAQFVEDQQVQSAELLLEPSELPLFAGFHGGKGVAPAAGVLLAVSPMAFGIAAGAFVVLLAACRVVSVASIGSSIALFIVLTILRWAAGKGIPDGLLLLSLALSGVIIVAHRSNLARLVAGKEPTAGRSLPDRDGSSSP